MTTFPSEDFKQVFGKFDAVNLPPASGRTVHSTLPNTTVAPASTYNTTCANLDSGFYVNADAHSNEKVLANLPLGSITYGPTHSWPENIITTLPLPCSPVVNLTPAQQKHIDQQREKVLEDQKKSTTAIRYDSGKADWSLMPWEAVEEINKVLEFGAKKYAKHNWQQGEGFSYTRVLNSLLRHVFSYMRGEDLDPESGLSHMAHAGCNVLFILYYIKNKSRYKNDDRYVQ